MSVAELVPDLRAEAGEALRSVGVYTGQEYELKYLREDVDVIYAAEEIDEIFDNLALQSLSKSYIEDLFNAGQLHCTLFHFDDALMFHFTQDNFSGLFVTIDTGAGIDIETFGETCKKRMSDLLVDTEENRRTSHTSSSDR